MRDDASEMPLPGLRLLFTVFGLQLASVSYSGTDSSGHREGASTLAAPLCSGPLFRVIF